MTNIQKTKGCPFGHVCTPQCGMYDENRNECSIVSLSKGVWELVNIHINRKNERF